MKTLVVVLLYSQLVVGKYIRDCTPQPHLNCSLYKFNGIDCSLQKLLVEFPELYNETSSFPGRPHDFNSSIDYDYLHSNGKHYASVNLTFTPMHNVGIKYVKGFEITQIRNDKTDPTCYIFDMSHAAWTDSVEDKQTIFSQHIGPLSPEKMYRYELYALPKPSPKQFDDYLALDISVPKSVTADKAQEWQTTISYRTFETEGRIEVSFYLPPEEFNFNEFYIWLKDNDTGNSIQRTRVDRNSFNFTSVDAGNYSIRNHRFATILKNGNNIGFDGGIKNTGWKNWFLEPCCSGNSGTCCRKEGIVVERGHCREGALYQYTLVPTTSSPTSSTPTTVKSLPPQSTPNSSDFSIKIILAVVGSVLCITLAVVAACIYVFKCREQPSLCDVDEKRGNVNEGCVETYSVITMDRPYSGKVNNLSVKNKIKFAKRPKLFLLFEDDHENHRLVVNNFASYLQQHCQCDVMCAEWQLDTAWVHEDLSCADYLVIINSEKAYNLYMEDIGRKSNRDSPPSRNRYSSSINSIRTQFVQEERYDNIVMVYFEYTDERFMIPDICPGYKYKLLKNFTEFLLHIHKLHRTDNLSAYDLPVDGMHNRRPIGQQLVDAIIAACQYENKKPRKELAMLRTCSKTSDPDSLIDSGLPEDIGSADITPSTDKPEQQFQSDIQRQLLQYLDGQSQDAVTIGPPETQIPSIPARKSNPVPLSPLQIDRFSTEPNSYTPSPITADSMGIEFEFVPPDDESNLDAISRSQSEQMKCIVDRYQAANTPSRGDLLANRMGTISEGQQGGYNKNVDLEMLKMNDTRIFQDGEDSISLGGQSV